MKYKYRDSFSFLCILKSEIFLTENLLFSPVKIVKFEMTGYWNDIHRKFSKSECKETLFEVFNISISSRWKYQGYKDT